jgi:O-antigen ligase
MTTMLVRRRSIRVLSAGVALVLLLGVIETASRGSLVGLAAVVAALLAVSRGIRARATICVVGAAAAGFLAVRLVAPPEVAARFALFSDGGTGRSDLWRVATKMTLDHPLFGVGAGNFRDVAPSYAGAIQVKRPDLVFVDPHVVHNTFLQFFVETGVVGGLIFALFVASSVRAARATAIGSADLAMRDLGRAVLVAVAGYLTALFFISGAYEKPLWVLLAIALRIPSYARSEDRML